MDMKLLLPQENCREVKNYTKGNREIHARVEFRIKSKKHRDKTKTKVKDILEITLQLKWNWGGHVACIQDQRWAKRPLEWRPRTLKRRDGLTTSEKSLANTESELPKTE